MDQLAREGMVFKRAYVQYAFCAPSRNSFMSTYGSGSSYPRHAYVA